MKTRLLKGFTLIELLIVIAIIAVLAVAFVPALLGSPAKARDAARVSDIQRMDTVLAARDLEGTGTLPLASGCIVPGTFSAAIEAKLGGTVPVDPLTDHPKNNVPPTWTCVGDYYFHLAPDDAGAKLYEYGLYAFVEDPAKGNGSCTGAMKGDIDGASVQDDSCFIVLRAK